jgi:hypothetical protein
MFKKNLLQSIAFLLFSISLVGCSHTLKMYEGKDLEPSELAFVYPHAGVTSVGIRYINDKHLDIHSSNAVVHLRPGSTRVTIVNFFNEFFYQAGQNVVRTTWTMFETPVELKAGFTYFAWTSEPNALSPREACLIELSHSDFVQKYGGHTRVPQTSPPPGHKAGCGSIIDAKDYVKLHGKP